jgi:hypothetical protein
MKKETDTEQDADILILYGMSEELVNYFESLFKSLGLHSSTVTDLPSRGMATPKKIDYYIKHCKIPFVLVTHDEQTGDLSRARPNVYNELGRCQKSRPKDTIILREKTVELGSNVEGIPCILSFEIDKIHLIMPKLIAELESRNLLHPESKGKDRMKIGTTMNKFVEQMDDIWDYEFDEAWKRIQRLDWEAERDFGDTLDKFFQQYHKAFSALVKNRKNDDEMRAMCDGVLVEARKCAAMAWEVVASSKMRKIDEVRKSIKETRKTLRYQRQYEEASSELRRGNRVENATEKIKCFRRAIELAEKYLNAITA